VLGDADDLRGFEGILPLSQKFSQVSALVYVLKKKSLVYVLNKVTKRVLFRIRAMRPHETKVTKLN
jgi:hypothetical protein